MKKKTQNIVLKKLLNILKNKFKNKYYENEVNVNHYLNHNNIIIFYEKKDIINDIYLIFEVANRGNINNNIWQKRKNH